MAGSPLVTSPNQTLQQLLSTWLDNDQAVADAIVACATVDDETVAEVTTAGATVADVTVAEEIVADATVAAVVAVVDTVIMSIDLRVL